MTRADTLTDKHALTILARDGIAAIWQLHIAAADAHQTGYPAAAAAMLEIAETAEAAWLRADGERGSICSGIAANRSSGVVANGTVLVAALLSRAMVGKEV